MKISQKSKVNEMSDKDSVVESLGQEILDYAGKGETSDEIWLNESFSRDASAWESEAARQKDAADIAAMTDAFDREREAYDAARAEGMSSAKYLMDRIDSAVVDSGSDNPQQTASEVYGSIMDGGRKLLGELGFDAPTEENAPEWNEENKGDMAKDMVGALSSRGVVALGDISEVVVTAADKRIAVGSDGDVSITDYVERQSKERSCKGLAVPMSAAIVKCARRGMFGEAMKKVPADAITTATCVASEGVKTLVRVGKGELSLDEGREKIAGTVCVAAGAYVGKKTGEKVGRKLGEFVGSVFGPAGTLIGGKIGSKVGAFVGHKVGKVVGKVVYKVGQVYRKARNWVKEKIGGGLSKLGRGICNLGRKIWRGIFG